MSDNLHRKCICNNYKKNIDAAKYLIKEHSFKYVLPAEKSFGQARQRKGGNFYIDVSDVVAAS